MEDIFIKDLKVEAEIDQEARRLVEQYADKAGGTIDRQKMFLLIKKQLVKDRNAVI